ncbi:MAG: Gfo/Idh/MocA family oxidoreductase [Clostridia bacterium]|nr:Gfo/Idh/MocA family oxidoreductase [Clostridia bacterium]
MLKVAMLSQWHVHAKGYANEFNQSGRAKIVAVWDEEPARGKAFAESLDCPFYENLDELLASDIDAVCVTTPTTMHRDVIAKACKAGKHIFTEKALEVTVEETEALAKEIEKSDKTFGISYPHKTNPVYRYIKARIAEGAFGKLSLIRYRNAHNGVSGNWLPEYWFDGTKSGGGAMMDLGCHGMYFLCDIGGKPKRISALFNQFYGTGLDENAICTVEFENGTIGVNETSFISYSAPGVVEIYGTEGSLIAVGDQITFNSELYKDKEVPALDKTPVESPIERFISACEKGEKYPAEMGLEEAMALTVLLDNSYKADEANKIVVL